MKSATIVLANEALVETVSAQNQELRKELRGGLKGFAGRLEGGREDDLYMSVTK